MGGREKRGEGERERGVHVPSGEDWKFALGASNQIKSNPKKKKKIESKENQLRLWYDHYRYPSLKPSFFPPHSLTYFVGRRARSIFSNTNKTHSITTSFPTQLYLEKGREREVEYLSPPPPIDESEKQTNRRLVRRADFYFKRRINSGFGCPPKIPSKITYGEEYKFPGWRN